MRQETPYKMTLNKITHAIPFQFFPNSNLALLKVIPTFLSGVS